MDPDCDNELCCGALSFKDRPTGCQRYEQGPDPRVGFCSLHSGFFHCPATGIHDAFCQRSTSGPEPPVDDNDAAALPHRFVLQLAADHPERSIRDMAGKTVVGHHPGDKQVFQTTVPNGSQAREAFPSRNHRYTVTGYTPLATAHCLKFTIAPITYYKETVESLNTPDEPLREDVPSSRSATRNLRPGFPRPNRSARARPPGSPWPRSRPGPGERSSPLPIGA